MGLFLLTCHLAGVDLKTFKSGALGYGYKTLLLLLPFCLVTYPLMIDQLYPVRGLSRTFFYPWQILIALLMIALYLAICHFLLIRLQISLNLSGLAPIPAKSFLFPEIKLALALPGIRGDSPAISLFSLEPLFQKVLRFWEARWLGVNSIYWIFLAAGLYTAGVTWLKRSLPQNKTYQAIFTYTLAVILSTAFYTALHQVYQG